LDSAPAASGPAALPLRKTIGGIIPTACIKFMLPLMFSDQDFLF
jgi:hypothetical protein